MRNKLREDQQKKIELLSSNNIDSYPSEVSRTHEIVLFLDNFDLLLESQKFVTLCGRVMAIRNQGGVVFLNVYDGTGTVQVIFKKSKHNYDSYNLFTKVVTLSDFIELNGVAVVTKRGVNSLNIEKWRMQSKSLRQVPNRWNGMKDENEKNRKRYLEILLNPDVANMIKKRSVFWNSVRAFMLERDFIEVETPILEILPVGAKVKQFISHHNALDLDVYLRISPELWHKKILIGGIPKVFEIGRVFRNEGISPEHAQDYTVFEFYEAFKDAREGIPMCIDLFRFVSEKTFGTLQFKIKGFDVDLGGDWLIVDFSQVIMEKFNIDPKKSNIEMIKSALDKKNISYEENIDERKGIDIMWKFAQNELGGPLFVTRIPYFFAPLGKRCGDDREVMEEFKIIIGGSELGHGFNELNDPTDQKKRFIEQQGAGENINDEDLIGIEHVEALEYGMPPTFGLGMSERVFSILSGTSIRESQIFPLMRPSNKKI